jgi:hypothetical protein
MNYLKKTGRAFVLALVFLSMTNVAKAGPFWCQTYVNQLFIIGTGDVELFSYTRSNYVQPCNINSTWKGVSPATCASWLGLARSAVARGASMLLMYSDVPSCEAIPTYSDAPAPYYVMLVN